MKGKVMDSMLMLLIIALIFSFAVAEAAGSGQGKRAGTEIPREALMAVPPGVKNRKAPVPFPHANHKTIECTYCHHTAYETLSMSKCSSDGCHSNTGERKGVGSFYAAFHEIFEKSDRSCLDCHKTRGKGPTACKGCHKQR